MYKCVLMVVKKFWGSSICYFGELTVKNFLFFVLGYQGFGLFGDSRHLYIYEIVKECTQ